MSEIDEIVDSPTINGDDEKSIVTAASIESDSDCSNDDNSRAAEPSMRRHLPTTVQHRGGVDTAVASGIKLSSRFDTCIIYALDECLTRGSYNAFARWFLNHICTENLPGSMVVIGFSPNGRTGNRGTATVNLGGEFPVPYIRLNPTDRYAIFDLKRQTGYPAVVLLITLPSSRMEMCLSCDGAIFIHARHTMRRNTIEVAEILRHLTITHLDHLYDRVNAISCWDDDTNSTCDNNNIYDATNGSSDEPTIECCSAESNSRVIGFERDLDAHPVYFENDEVNDTRQQQDPYEPSKSSSIDNSNNDSVIARVSRQNRNMVDALCSMDSSKLSGHSSNNGLIPVIRGESVDIPIPMRYRVVRY